MIERNARARDLGSLVVARIGSPAETGNVWDPYELSDPCGGVVEPVAVSHLDSIRPMGATLCDRAFRAVVQPASSMPSAWRR